MESDGIDKGADIPFHTSDGCLKAGSDIHIQTLGNISQQCRVLGGSADAVDCVTKPYIGVVDTEAPEQVTDFSFVFHIYPSLVFVTNDTLNAEEGIDKGEQTTKLI